MPSRVKEDNIASDEEREKEEDEEKEEEEEEEEEVHQACFILHSAQTKAQAGVAATAGVHSSVSPSKGKRKQCEKLGTVALPACLSGEPPECGAWRMEAFKSTWARFEHKIQDALQQEILGDFKVIRKYVFDTQFCDAQLKLLSSPPSIGCVNSSRSSRTVSKRLHTALILTRNLDSSDHRKTFQDLATHLRQNHCHVASLFPHNFSSRSGIAAPLSSLLKQIIGIQPDTTDMDILVSWHKEQGHEKYPVVVVIENVEHCNSVLLAEFITVLSDWVKSLPLVLILGVSTLEEALRRLLPASALRCLHVQKFMLQTPAMMLGSVFRAVLLDPVGAFSIGGDVTEFLLNLFRSHDSSVFSFLRALKIACMEHFCTEPLSFLCKTLSDQCDQMSLEEICRDLPKTLLDYASGLPSVKSQKFVEHEKLAKTMAHNLYDLVSHKKHWSATYQCLLEAGQRMGLDAIQILKEVQQKRTLNAFSDEEKIDGATIEGLLLKIREMPLSSLVDMLNDWEAVNGNLEEFREEIRNLLAKINSERGQDEIPKGSLFRMGSCDGSARRKRLLSSLLEGVEETQPDASNSSSVNHQTFEQETSQVKEEQVLLASDTSGTKHSKSQKIMTEVKSILLTSDSKSHNKMAVDILRRMISSYLVPFESLPFHEIVCFKDVKAIRQALFVETRKKIQTDILHPSLKCSCCRQDGVSLSASMHDTSLMYNLAQRHGEHANIHDWYQSFAAVLMSPQSPQGRKKTPKRKKDETVAIDKALIQARFTKAASELQFVGLLRAANRKRSDFVQIPML